MAITVGIVFHLGLEPFLSVWIFYSRFQKIMETWYDIQCLAELKKLAQDIEAYLGFNGVSHLVERHTYFVYIFYYTENFFLRSKKCKQIMSLDQMRDANIVSLFYITIV